MKLSLKLLGRAILPLAAVGLIGFALATMAKPKDSKAPPPAPPATAPVGSTSVVAALGLVEPSSEVIGVGSELSGVVREVFVQPGALVNAGTPLFRLDARAQVASLDASQASARQAAANATAVAARVPSLRAAIGAADAAIVSANAAILSAQGSLDQARGRLGSAVAAAETARLVVADADARLRLFESVGDTRAISTDERDRARFAASRAQAAYEQARAGVQEAQGGLKTAIGGLADAQARSGVAKAQAMTARANVTEAGANIASAQAGAEQVRAQSRVVATDLDRLTVRAPIAGQVLRLNIRVGEFASAGTLATPLVAMGVVDPMHVRVQIDEEDAPRVAAGAKAEASPRGAGDRSISLRFVRFEPQAKPKTNLNGGSERVDTRVIEAIYAFNRGDLPVFVGQQMDVFIEAAPLPSASTAPAKTENAK